MLVGDFEETLGIKDYWANSDERDNDMFYARIYLCVFAYFVIMLFISIVLSIKTDPGRIPEDREWDLPENIEELIKNMEQTTQDKQEQFTNAEMIEDSREPTETMHFDYRYIKSKAGPLYKNKNETHHIFKAKPIIKSVAYEKKEGGGVRMC
jgi:hypothetical protein